MDQDHSLVFESPAMGRAIDALDRVAPTEITVLITGETGTGKELAARRLHARSRHAAGPLVAVNCAAIPEHLVEGELFGHEAGAFTGAQRRRAGRVEQAHHGTLFLDEVGDLAPGAQSKLLRALQERAVDRLGGDAPIPVAFRLVAATHRDLAAAVAAGAFRQDLYFRLRVVPIHLPPLRDRGGDLRILARHCFARAVRSCAREGLTLTEAGLAFLEARPWPGNVRELESCIVRAVALAPPGTAIGPEHLAIDPPSEPPPSATAAAGLRDLIEHCEREIIQRTLARHDNNRTRAASALGLSRQALQQRLARLRAAPPQR
jgi:transcriptional regulator with PAS, ATPase and Fis domain